MGKFIFNKKKNDLFYFNYVYMSVFVLGYVYVSENACSLEEGMGTLRAGGYRRL